MSLIRKRKLTHNQVRRIENNAPVDEASLATGVIVAHFGKQLDVQVTALADSEQVSNTLNAGQIYRCHTRTNLPMLATGDKVKISFDDTAQLGRIESLLARDCLITRPDRYHKIKPVAANVELLAIVFAPLPKAATSLIDRYLLIAHINGVTPLLVLNKADLLPDFPDVAHLYQEYIALGYHGVQTSVPTGDGLAGLQGYIGDKFSIFAGQSGVGKSSLINHLLPHALQDINVISSGSKLGQHTTTTSRLIAYDPSDLTQGGIIDTPGIREYGIWHLSPDDILAAFSELAPLASLCRFRDCKHSENSKGCALWQAAADGQVLARRVLSLTQLQEETRQA